MLIQIYELITWIIYCSILIYAIKSGTIVEKFLFLIVTIYASISYILNNPYFLKYDFGIIISIVSIPTLLRFFSKKSFAILNSVLFVIALYLLAEIIFTLKYGYNIRGSVLSVTTYRLMIINILCYGCYINIINKKNIKVSALVIFFSIILSVLSLGKWQIFFLLSNLIILQFYIKNKFYILLFTIAIIVLLDIFLLNISGYESLSEFFYKRIYDVNPSNPILVIRDGGRYEMWLDLLWSQFSNPFFILLGMGLGIRALSEEYIDLLPPEDHNLVIFILVRFGFILGPIIIILIFKKIMHYINIEKGNPRFIKICLFINCIFISLVTTPFTKILSILLFCYVITRT